MDKQRNDHLYRGSKINPVTELSRMDNGDRMVIFEKRDDEFVTTDKTRKTLDVSPRLRWFAVQLKKRKEASKTC